MANVYKTATACFFACGLCMLLKLTFIDLDCKSDQPNADGATAATAAASLSALTRSKLKTTVHTPTVSYMPSVEEWALQKKATNGRGFVFDFLFEDASTYAEPVSLHQIAFVMLGCADMSYRLRSHLYTWLTMTRNFFFLTDHDVVDLPNVISLTELIKNDKKSTTRDLIRTISTGDLRKYFLWLIRHHSVLSARHLKWIAVLDDDTWMNVPKLLDFLANYNPAYNIAIGNVNHQMYAKAETFLLGGSGVIFTRSAIVSMIGRLVRPPCSPHRKMSLWGWNRTDATLMVHSDKFHHWSVPLDKLLHHYVLMPQRYLAEISFHCSNNALAAMKMTCDVVDHWNFEPLDYCEDLRMATNNSFYLKLRTPENFTNTFDAG